MKLKIIMLQYCVNIFFFESTIQYYLMYNFKGGFENKKYQLKNIILKPDKIFFFKVLQNTVIVQLKNSNTYAEKSLSKYPF